MSKKNNFLILLLVQLLFLFIILFIIPSLLIKEKPGTNQVFYNQILPLDIKHSYLQKITTDQDHLNSISLLIKNPALKSIDTVTIKLQDQNKNTIQKLSINGSSIGDPSWIRFKFEPLNSKTNDTFYIQVSSNSPKDNFLYLYGDQNSQQLNFQTTYKSSSFQETFQNNFKFQIKQFINRNPILTTLYLLILLSINRLIFISL